MADTTRWFRRLVRLLPADFQADHARDMERTFRAQEREARTRGRRGVAALWWDTACDLLRTAPREHFDQIAQDTRYAVRLFRRAPAFSAVAVLTLAVAIGANTAVFSVVDAVLLRPLPFRDADRLVRIHESRPASGLLRNSASGPNILDWQAQATSLTGIAAYRRRSINLSGAGEPRYVHAARASASFFDVLGVRPARGRAFTEAEDRENARVAVITDGLWRSQYGADAAVIGRRIDLDGEPFLVIGVLPAAFRFHLESDIWIPLGLYPGTRAGRGSHNMSAVARLKEGRSVDDAQAELAAIAARLERAYPETNTGWTVLVEPLRDSTVHEVRPLALILWGAVGFVLLVACANVGSMLVARASVRSCEFSVRIALGANRTRLVRQLLTESVMLSLAGGVAGVAFAALLIDNIRRFTALPVPRLDEAGLHPPVLIVTLAIAVTTGILFGVAPAFHVGRWEFGGTQRSSSRGVSAGRDRRRMQAVLNIVQVAVAVMLLAGAGLMIRTLIRLEAVDAGFEPRGILAIALALSDARYPTDEEAIRFYARVVDEVKRAPGVREAALVSDPPLTGGAGYWENGFEIEGRPPKPPGDGDFAYLRWITPEYFRTVGVQVVEGRSFSDDDALGRPPVVIVNEAMVRRHFPGENPIGRRLRIGIRDDGPREIVGVVADYHQTALDDRPQPQMFLPVYQSLTGGGTLLVRAEGTPESIAETVRVALRRVDPLQPVFNIRLMEEDVEASVAPRTLTMRALTVFAIVALGLALLGIYAVAAYQVGERTREIGLRVALGARAADVVLMIVRQGLVPAAAGVLAGLLGAAAFTNVLRGLLFGVSSEDPATYAATAALMILTSLLACLVPARRATRVDPSIALRAE